MKWFRWIERQKRRRFGRYEIDDPRPNAVRAPYTYFLPSHTQISAIMPGDIVKVVVRSIPPSSKWDAERIWIKVRKISGNTVTGTVDNEPFDIPQVKCDDVISFPAWSVIDILWSEKRPGPPLPHPERREYWERCMVDDCVLQGRSPVEYLYREQPEPLGPDDEYPDSGWRIRGNALAIEEDEMLDRGPKYVAIGAVLNHDDSWLHLIDEALGSRFTRDPANGAFVVDTDNDLIEQ